MKTLKTAPLTVILVVTSLLGLATIYPTLMLFYLVFSGQSQTLNERLLNVAAVCVPIIGYVLLLSYFVAAFFKRHSKILWICSSLFNFALCGLSAYLFFNDFASRTSTTYFLRDNLPYSVCAVLFIIWTLFVALASLYYARFAHVLGFQKLP